ncbi:MAG: hypothetical protein AAB886_02335 [Patescibacteria group bacterium]
MSNDTSTPGLPGLGARPTVTLSRGDIDAIAAALLKTTRFGGMIGSAIAERTDAGVDALVEQAGQRVLAAAQGVADATARDAATRARVEFNREAVKLNNDAEKRVNALGGLVASKMLEGRKEARRRFWLFCASFAGIFAVAAAIFIAWTFAMNGRVQKSEEKLANAEERMSTIADGAARIAVDAKMQPLTERVDAIARNVNEQRELLNTHTGEIAELQDEDASLAKKLGAILNRLDAFGQRLFTEESVTAAISSDFVPSGMDNAANSRLCREQEPKRKTDDGADILKCRDGINGKGYTLACRPSPAGWTNCRAHLTTQ